MVHFSQAFAAALLATVVVAHPGGNTNKEILRRQAHLDHPNRRSVQECKRDLVESGWVREQHLRREARLHELRVAAGFAKPEDLVRRDVGEVEEEYGQKAACTLDPESTEGPYCKSSVNYRSSTGTDEKQGFPASSSARISSTRRRAPSRTLISTSLTPLAASQSQMLMSSSGALTPP
jgi:hypothetical protein